MRLLKRTLMVTVAGSLLACGINAPMVSAALSQDQINLLAEESLIHKERVGRNEELTTTYYRDVVVEKTGYKDVEVPVYGEVTKTGYKDVVVTKTGTRNVTKYKTEKKTKQVPYTVKEDVYKTTYTYTTKQVTQAYTKASTKNRLTATNSKGTKYDVTVNKGTTMTKVDNNWYKTTLKYTDYKKVGKVYQKQSKSTVAYVPAKYINTDTKKVKTGTKNVTKYKTVTENVQVPYTVKETYTYKETVKQPYTYKETVKTGTKIEKQPYTYTEVEKQPYTVTSTVYKVDIKESNNSTEDTISELFTSIVMNKINDENTILSMLKKAGIQYNVLYGYERNYRELPANKKRTILALPGEKYVDLTLLLEKRMESYYKNHNSGMAEYDHYHYEENNFVHCESHSIGSGILWSSQVSDVTADEAGNEFIIKNGVLQ